MQKGKLCGEAPAGHFFANSRFSFARIYNTIILAKSGITGYWQVNRHSNVIFENRLIMDCWYIGNWSFWLDLVLLLKTIGIVLDKKGAK